MEGKKHIIYGVLDWGLGHATRSVPVIEALIKHGFDPVLASDGLAQNYLKREFPDLAHETLRSYNIKYGPGNFLVNMMAQLPNIYEAVKFEHKELKKLVEKYQACGVISDNRLGFYHAKVPSVYLTHQLTIKAPFPFSMATSLHSNYIKKYSECWVPDFEKEPSLSGDLGRGKLKKPIVKYIGPLSRFTRSNTAADPKYDLCMVLSGPEPQRTNLEDELIHQLKELDGSFLLIRGKQLPFNQEVPENLEVIDIALSEDLPGYIRQSKIVLSRSGYSSLMDYYFLGNKALLIPTPGQVEQEYLASKLKKDAFFYSVNQEELNLEKDLAEAGNYPGFSELQEEMDLRNWSDLFGLFQSK